MPFSFSHFLAPLPPMPFAFTPHCGKIGADRNQGEAMAKNGNGNGKTLDLPALENWLWEAACVLRGPLDAPKYKDYILPLVVLKRLSDVFDNPPAPTRTTLTSVSVSVHRHHRVPTGMGSAHGCGLGCQRSDGGGAGCGRCCPDCGSRDSSDGVNRGTSGV